MKNALYMKKFFLFKKYIYSNLSKRLKNISLMGHLCVSEVPVKLKGLKGSTKTIWLLPFFALRIRPILWASCLREPPWAEIWIKTLASGRSKDVSATCVYDLKLYFNVVFFTITLIYIYYNMKMIFYVSQS